MNPVSKFFILAMVNMLLQSVKPSNEELAFPNGLKVGDLLEWKGRISAVRSPSSLYLNSSVNGTNGYLVMKLQIQGARNRFTVFTGRRGEEKQHQLCRLGETLIARNKEFWLILRFFNNKIFVYWNGDLKYTLPLKPNFAAESLGAIRSARFYGSHQTERFQVLTNETMAQIMESDDCGFVTPGKLVPGFCGSRPNGSASCRILGGVPATPGMQPWQASIRKKPQLNSNFGAQSHICGATLIGNCWAIAAGHCFLSRTRSSWEKLVVRVGDYYNKDNNQYSRFAEAERSQDLEIAYVYHHGEYEHSSSPRNDIALIKLRRCLPNFNDFVRPACLPRSIYQFRDGTRCGISGWGASNITQHITEYPNCLQTAGVKLIDSATCQRAHEERSFDPKIMFCAGNRCVDACHGDSGGPLMCPQPGGERFTLWGITSWGIGCGDLEKPGVYTKVAKYIPWMFQKMFMVDDEEIENRIKARTITRSHCQHRS